MAIPFAEENVIQQAMNHRRRRMDSLVFHLKLALTVLYFQRSACLIEFRFGFGGPRRCRFRTGPRTMAPPISMPTGVSFPYALYRESRGQEERCLKRSHSLPVAGRHKILIPRTILLVSIVAAAMLLQQLLRPPCVVSAMRLTVVRDGRHRFGLQTAVADSARGNHPRRNNSSLAAARKRPIQREDFLSIDEAMGNRCPPSLESYDTSEDFDLKHHAVVSFQGTSPTASPVDQTRTPSPQRNSPVMTPSFKPNFAAIPDFDGFNKDDDDFSDDDEPLVVEQMVSEVLSYQESPESVSTNDDAFSSSTTPFGKSISSVLPTNYVPQDITPTTVTITQPKPTYVTPTVEELEMTMETVLAEITAQNNGAAINVNSSKQVATLLFGSAGGSTKKDILEGMAAAGNRMADLILKYRDAKFKLGKMRRRNESFAKGTAVTSALTVKRAYNETFSTDDDQRDPLILVDASAYIFRAYFSMYVSSKSFVLLILNVISGHQSIDPMACQQEPSWGFAKC